VTNILLLAFLRRIIRAGQRREGIKSKSSNPLIFCGKSEREISEVLRSISIRATTAQLLASLIAFTLLADYVLNPERLIELALYALLVDIDKS
jgi:hypothetical protein